MESPVESATAKRQKDTTLEADLPAPTTTEMDNRPSPATQPTFQDLTTLVSALIVQQQQQQQQFQQQREEQLRQQEQHREEQLRQQEQHREDQLRQQELLERPATRREEQPATIRPKLNRLTETDDIEAYLVTFERLMASSRVSQEDWTLHLAPQLSGKAQKAYAALDAHTARDYEAVKEGNLLRHAITPETYRIRFRKARRDQEESL